MHNFVIEFIKSMPSLQFMLLAITFSIGMVLIVRSIQLSGNQKKHSMMSKVMVGGPEVMTLKARSRASAIREMVEVVSMLIRWPDETTILKSVLKREDAISTGLVNGIAVPHARFPNLPRSLVVFGRSLHGIDWDCLDGKPAYLIFLIISPEEDEKTQLKLLSEIGRCADDSHCLEILNEAHDCKSVLKAIEHINSSK
jgi:fructose PTS system EIIA component